jgi:NAD(P)-dependent dehydrogenase (short-subunit alcohol dehydrogenase family)
MKITNTTILVTGANRGLGKALVEEALRKGGAANLRRRALARCSC